MYTARTRTSRGRGYAECGCARREYAQPGRTWGGHARDKTHFLTASCDFEVKTSPTDSYSSFKQIEG